MSFQTEASHTNVSNAGNPYTLPTKKKNIPNSKNQKFNKTQFKKQKNKNTQIN